MLGGLICLETFRNSSSAVDVDSLFCRNRLGISVIQGGWQPVDCRSGAGGTHYKFRRKLKLSGVVQTLILPTTPSDSQRGVRNAASNMQKLDRERNELEAAAAATAAGAEAQGLISNVASSKNRCACVACVATLKG
jgi:hypothetical protein